LFEGLTDEWVYLTFNMKFLLPCQLAANLNKLLLALSVGLSFIDPNNKYENKQVS
jgi:hypothetical protein